jgi:hypothetical protein
MLGELQRRTRIRSSHPTEVAAPLQNRHQVPSAEKQAHQAHRDPITSLDRKRKSLKTAHVPRGARRHLKAPRSLG